MLPELDYKRDAILSEFNSDKDEGISRLIDEVCLLLLILNQIK